MASPEGRPRFECPADFSPCVFSPEPAFSPKALQSPSKQLWLIRAPANFTPESLDGHSVPLLGSQMLKVPGMQKVYNVQAVAGDLDSAHLLMPSGRQDRLTCAPSFSGMLSICERFGDPCANQPLLPVAARPVPQIPTGLRQRFLPFGGRPQGHSGPEAAEEPPRKRKKKRALHTAGYMEAPEEPLPPNHEPCPGEASVAPAGDSQEGSRRHKRKHRGVLLPPVSDAAPQSQSDDGSQPSGSLEGASQERLSCGGGSRRKRKKLKEEPDQLELDSFPQQPGLQVACAADGSGPGEEGPTPHKPKKKKKRRQEDEAAAAAALTDVPSVKQEAAGSPEATLEGRLAQSPPRGRHKKKKVVADEPQGAGAAWLGLDPVQLEGAQEGLWLPGEEEEEARQKHKKKKKKHKHEAAAAEESRVA